MTISLDVDWGSIGLVTVATLVAAVVIVTFYSLGLRLLATGSGGSGGTGDSGASGSSDGETREPRPLAATIGAVACIGVGVLAVLYGIYLVIPFFHAS